MLFFETMQNILHNTRFSHTKTQVYGCFPRICEIMKNNPYFQFIGFSADFFCAIHYQSMLEPD